MTTWMKAFRKQVRADRREMRAEILLRRKAGIAIGSLLRPRSETNTPKGRVISPTFPMFSLRGEEWGRSEKYHREQVDMMELRAAMGMGIWADDSEPDVEYLGPPLRNGLGPEEDYSDWITEDESKTLGHFIRIVQEKTKHDFPKRDDSTDIFRIDPLPGIVSRPDVENFSEKFA